MKILCGMIALASASVAVANNTASLPKDKVTKYVVENLGCHHFAIRHTAKTRPRQKNLQRLWVRDKLARRESGSCRHAGGNANKHQNIGAEIL